METDTNYELKIGSPAPDFSLKATDFNMYSLESFDKEVLVIIFSCNHCPFVQANEARMIALQNEFKESAQFIAINSNSNESHPDDSFDKMVKRAEEKEFNFIYAVDDTQEIAHKYGAQVTPEVFVFDKNRTLQYHGRIDENTYKNDAHETHDLKNAIQQVLVGEPITKPETPSTGCSIKWK